MTTEPIRLDWDAVRTLDAATTVCWCSRPLVERLRSELPFAMLDSQAFPPPGTEVLLVVGGGSLIDKAKLWRATESPETRLVAVPSIWGSGADASPVVVFDRDGAKVTKFGPEFLPDARAVWPPLAGWTPTAAARHGYGDVWSHALEAFVSPLASDGLREEIAVFLMQHLLAAPFEAIPAWFDLAAKACWLQSRAGVGLVHGAAHDLEPAVMRPGGETYTHAQLCSLLLWPVMRFNRARSSKVTDLAARHGLPWDAIDARIRELHDPAAFAQLLPSLQNRWPSILRQPLTRLNCALVRPDAIRFFCNKEYEHAA